jgi:ketosteroid isomerase-like protein
MILQLPCNLQADQAPTMSWERRAARFLFLVHDGEFRVVARELKSCQDFDVKTPTLLLLVLLALASTGVAADCPKDQPKNEAALVQLEQNWAAALSRKDADTVACMLAKEFEDAAPDGSLHTRTETLELIPHRKSGTNQLSEMRAHVEGDSGFTRGLATLVDASGKVVARVRFTDVFTYRDGRWQALAGQESLVPEVSY